jgi:hypothetical protein
MTVAEFSAGAELDRDADGRPAVIGGTGTAMREAAASDTTPSTDEPQFVQNF